MVVNTSLFVHEIVGSNPDKYYCVFFNVFLLSKFILDLSDIGEGKHRQETWQYKFEIANPSWESVAITAHAVSVWEESFAQLWDSNMLVLILKLIHMCSTQPRGIN